MRAAKVDGNHKQIVDGLRAVHLSVESLARVGNGCPDILIGGRRRLLLVEIKMPGEKLNGLQEKWHATWDGGVHVVHSLDEALNLCRRERLLYGWPANG